MQLFPNKRSPPQNLAQQAFGHANPIVIATMAYRKTGGSFRVWQVGKLTREKLAQIVNIENSTLHPRVFQADKDSNGTFLLDALAGMVWPD